MDRKTFFIVTALMITTVCLTKIQDFNCSGREYTIALVYDCRYSLKLQQDFFFQFLYRFKSLKFYISVILMTYGRSNLLTFDKLTKENMTENTFHKASSQLNTSSCPQHLPLKTLFNDTRDALSGVNETVIKLAVFVLSENLIEYENDDVTVSRGLVNEQSLNVDVKRLFILVKPSVELEIKNQTLIYTSTLKKYVDIVKTIIQHICNSCNDVDQDIIKIKGNCYHVLRLKYELTALEVSLLCREYLPYTRSVYFNSKWEYEQFISQWDILLEKIAHHCREGKMLYEYGIVCNKTLVNGIQVIDFDAAIGLIPVWSNVSKVYTWNDGTPLLFDPPWGSRSRVFQCVYMSQKYYYNGDQWTKEKLEWNEFDCDKKKTFSFAVCKSEGIDVEKRSLNINDFKPKKQESNVHLLYKSFSPILFIYINRQLKNEVKYELNKNKSQNFISFDSFDNTYLIDPGASAAKCLYEISSYDGSILITDTAQLQDCEDFVCPQGFIKCPDSYCIPTWLVENSGNDCPQREDEDFIKSETILCLVNLTFTLRNICLQQELCNANGQCINRTNDFICQVPCDTGYVCVSNIVRKEIGNDTIFYINFFEITVEIYETLGLFIFTTVIYSIFELFKLVELDVSNCAIRELDNVIESLDSSNVIILDVSNNSISGNNNLSVIQEMKTLQKLNMSFNKHLELGDNFIFPLYLQVLDLSHTQCGSDVIKYLVNLTCLKILELRNVDPIDLSLTGNVQLDILDVRGTELINIKDGYLSWLSIQTALYTDDFRICCQVVRGPNITEDKCHAPRDAVSTCQDLIGDPQKRVILWLVGILSLLGNMVVVIYRIVWDRAVFNKAYGLFVVCLGVSDFIMGVYLIIIAGADLFYRNLYALEDSNWRYGDICKLAGILSTFSSETSTMFICLITFDRYLVIKYPFGQHRFSKAWKITSLCLTLIIGVIISVIPVLFPGWEIYSSNGMCLALPFSSGRHTGWEYSAILFVGLNFVLFILIAIGQLAIFLAITSYKHDSFCGTRDDLRKAQELSIAKQLFTVAFSDFCCWFPIGIMGIMSLNGFQFNLDIYAWSAVLVLPVNSAINPLIYTLPAILRKIKSVYVVFY